MAIRAHAVGIGTDYRGERTRGESLRRLRLGSRPQIRRGNNVSEAGAAIAEPDAARRRGSGRSGGGPGESHADSRRTLDGRTNPARPLRAAWRGCIALSAAAAASRGIPSPAKIGPRPWRGRPQFKDAPVDGDGRRVAVAEDRPHPQNSSLLER